MAGDDGIISEVLPVDLRERVVTAAASGPTCGRRSSRQSNARAHHGCRIHLSKAGGLPPTLPHAAKAWDHCRRRQCRGRQRPGRHRWGGSSAPLPRSTTSAARPPPRTPGRQPSGLHHLRLRSRLPQPDPQVLLDAFRPRRAGPSPGTSRAGASAACRHRAPAAAPASPRPCRPPRAPSPRRRGARRRAAPAPRHRSVPGG